MKSFALLGATLALGLTLVAGDADAARRFGAGKSSGMQRQELTQPKSTNATPATPSQAPGAAATPANAQQAGAAAQAAQPKRSWMGPLAGLAAGIGLAALASHFGFGEQLASMMMMGLIAVAAMMLIGFFMRRRAVARQPALAGAGGMHYTGNASQTYQPAQPTQATGGTSLQSNAAPATAGGGNIPADFDAEAFVRNAKVNFIRLQAANDAGNLDDIRQFTTPEMFAEIRLQYDERHGKPQRTDIVNLNAAVLDVATEGSRHVVSTRFYGMLREEDDAAPTAFDEVWHLVKPVDGSRGWMVAGIQQRH